MRDLTDDESELIGRCLRAAADGSFFPDEEFWTLFGFTRDDVRQRAARWTPHSEIGPDSMPIVRGVLNNLLGYPHGADAELAERVGTDRFEISRVAEKLGFRQP